MTFPFPFIPPKASAAAGFSCNITVGNFAATFYGYSTADGPFGAFGSIDGEPIPGQTLTIIGWQSSGAALAVQFEGDITATISALNVWVNGVNYGGAGSWSYNGGSDRTELTLGAGPTLTSGTYLAEFK